MNTLLPIFKALADRNRLRIFGALLFFSELCACQITELLQISGATASRHLGIMINAGLIESRKDGRWIYYKLHDTPQSFAPVRAWIKTEFTTAAEIQADKKQLEKILSCGQEEIFRRQRDKKPLL
ncbi:MAG TPA: ArsR family transcriptional regulator [Proteobacteria bacterium]|nr:ArsR family transcriptional regulator [Pseudomonadota bacterium]